MKKINLLLIVIFSFMLVGCFPLCPSLTAEVKPNRLPAGKVGEPYHAQITIKGALAYLSFVSPQEPLSKLNIDMIPPSHDTRDDGYILTISGTPEVPEKYTIEVQGSTPGTMCAGKSFNKKYIINIME